MKKSKRPDDLKHSHEILHPPAYPSSSFQVIKRLKKALDSVECGQGSPLTLRRFADLLGAPWSTIHDWYYGDLVEPIRYFICGLERLPEPQRSSLLSQLCRDCPRLDHPRLQFDPPILNKLKTFLSGRAGLLLVIGDRDDLRTFAVTAIGNSIRRLSPRKSVCGLDLHKPERFVPVPGVTYFCPGSVAELRLLTKGRWRQIEDSGAELMLFNGIWTLVPELQARIVALARERLVLLADNIGPFSIRNGEDLEVSAITAEPHARNQVRLFTYESPLAP